MKKQWVLWALGIAALAMALIVVGGRSAQADMDRAPATELIHAPAATLVVTSTADSGAGTLRWALQTAVASDTITFDTGVFPPGNPQTITLTSGLPEITQGHLTVDGSNAGVILDGHSIGATPETVLLDDVSLTLDGGPNQIINGDFGAGLGHWRPWGERPGATRSLNHSDFHSSPNSYEWNVVARALDSHTAYDTTDTSDPVGYPFSESSSTAWITATGGSTVELRFWYKYGGLSLGLFALFPDGGDDIRIQWFSPQANWTEAVIIQTLPGDATAVGITFGRIHSERWVGGLQISSDGNTVQGLQIVRFPGDGITVFSGSPQNNLIGGDSTLGAGPLGQGNLISGNGGDGVFIGGSSTVNNTLSGNFIGTDVNGTTIFANNLNGIRIDEQTSYNRIGGMNATPGGKCSGECNLISGNGERGIRVIEPGTTHTTISGNYIGTDVSGTSAIGNTESGVIIRDGAQYNVIGGDTPGERNLISGNGENGVELKNSSNSTVTGNYIGTDVSGTAALPNHEAGIRIYDGDSYNLVGGDTPGERNLISGNRENGVLIEDATHTTLSGNYIGTDASGTNALGNTQVGVKVTDGASNITIGGHTAGERNLISGNSLDGVFISGIGTMSNTVSGNYIGTDVNGTAALGNSTGIYVSSGASYNIIGGENDTPGGACTGECNLISGNGDRPGDAGVRISDSGTMSNTISGNYIGTDVNGTVAIPNGDGVQINAGASYNVVGSDTPGERNLISSNSYVEVYLHGAMSTTVIGNYIGTNSSGTAAVSKLQSDLYYGIQIDGGARFNHIGGDTPAERNLISGNGSGIGIGTSGTMNNTVSGNYIGTDVNGTAAIGNSWVGVGIGNGAQYNIIGGINATPGTDCSGECNVISGNGDAGVIIEVSGTMSNTISGNYIGTDVNGTAALPNERNGVIIADRASHNVIGGENDTPGGACTGECNLISGNDRSGVVVEESGTMSNTVSGNYIGTDVNGTAAISNEGDGVFVRDGASHNLIGGDTSAERNLISGNGGDGVYIGVATSHYNIVSGNYIGVNAPGTGALGNAGAGVVTHMGGHHTIGGSLPGEGNLISGNGGSGIDIKGVGVMDDAPLLDDVSLQFDGGANQLLNGDFSDGLLHWSTDDDNPLATRTLNSDKYHSPPHSYQFNRGGGLGDLCTVYDTLTRTVVLTDESSAWISVPAGTEVMLSYWYSGTLARASLRGLHSIEGESTLFESDLGASADWTQEMMTVTIPDGFVAVAVEFRVLSEEPTANNTIIGNYIGTDAFGTAAIGNTKHGVLIRDGARDIVVGGNTAGERNLISGNGGHGVKIEGTDTADNIIAGNYIGTDVDGTTVLPNGYSGFHLSAGASHNLIGGINGTPGGACTGACNLISGNDENGVMIEEDDTTSNTVSGNYVGTDASGTNALANGVSGVQISHGASNNLIGGDAAGERNLISGNGIVGVLIAHSGTTSNTVSGNYIGTGVSGMVALGNGIGNGVRIYSGAENNTIGGDTPGERNVISGNDYSGILLSGDSYGDPKSNIVSGNYIGTNASGTAALPNDGHGVQIGGDAQDNTIGPGNVIAHNSYDGVGVSGSSTTGNTITQNRIYANEQMGIDLTSGANRGIAAPVIARTAGSFNVLGIACPGCTVELFENSDTDGEGESYVGTAIASPSGNFTVTIGTLLLPYLTATATDAVSGTSEFSAVFTVTERGSVYLPIVLNSH